MVNVMFQDLKVSRDKSNWPFCTFREEDEAVKRYVTTTEAEKAREVIESGDPYKIDNFCYRIY